MANLPTKWYVDIYARHYMVFVIIEMRYNLLIKRRDALQRKVQTMKISLRLFAKKGYHSVTVADIIKEAKSFPDLSCGAALNAVDHYEGIL